MVKIKISYENREELHRVLKRLGVDTAKVKTSGNQAGKFRKAYIQMRI